MYRAFHSSVPPVLVKSLFPPEYFGSLVGFVRFSLGVTSLLMLGLPEIPKTYGEAGFKAIFYCHIASQVVLFFFPVMLIKKLRTMQ